MELPRHTRLRVRTRVFGLLLALGACRGRHEHVASVPDLGYPRCADAGPANRTSVLAERHLRSGETSLERNIVEDYWIHDRGCTLVVTSRQEWRLGAADVEVVYDRDWNPLRAWRRNTLPMSPREDGGADTRRYELRTPEVTIKRRSPDGIAYEVLHGTRPRVVIASGRGVLSAWLRRARLSPGQQVREPALDVRETIETIRAVTLRREADLVVPWRSRPVRAYTIYGREPILADENDFVIGDLAGLRPAETVRGPLPPRLPTYGGADPLGTP